MNRERKELDRYAFALILLVTSLFFLTPARADQTQPQPGNISFHLIGQAISMNTTVGSLGSATLDLTGGSLGDGQGGLMMQNLTGNLKISSVNYPIFTGDGKSDMLGNLTMLGDSSSGELLLQGTIQHNSIVTTDPTLSRLASLAYLALSGNVMLSTAGGSLTQLESNLNSTSTFENLTSTDSAQQFSSSTVNSTSQSQIVENVTQSTTSVNQNASYVMSGQRNGTITTTQFNNQTITVYMSSTVANTTITQTTTTTVTGEANTQSSTSLSNSTATVTNSSSTAP